MTDLMLEFVLNLLTPFLVAGGLTDPAIARQTAKETIAAYNAPGQPLTVAQIITFALAAIDNLRLALPDDVSMSMKLKLRGNANALNRASQKAADTLDATKPQTTNKPAGPPLPASTQPQDQAWAAAMTEIATEYTAELPHLPPAQHRAHLARISALSDIAKTLATNNAPPLKARLLGSTAMQA
jgi:hypothetical protein